MASWLVTTGIYKVQTFGLFLCYLTSIVHIMTNQFINVCIFTDPTEKVRIQLISQRNTIKEGDNITLRCSGNGNPPPEEFLFYIPVSTVKFQRTFVLIVLALLFCILTFKTNKKERVSSALHHMSGCQDGLQYWAEFLVVWLLFLMTHMTAKRLQKHQYIW